ncbi:MAG: Fe-S cluster assembly protein IscX [Nitrospirae bacterium]|nr:Fe-S cluster assembly protein IscX [Nitrospirota bacterium]
MDLMWPDAEEIALRLIDRYPDLDPLTVRFTQLHQWVTELAEFKDNPKASNEKILEAIQMAWHEEYKAAHE